MLPWQCEEGVAKEGEVRGGKVAVFFSTEGPSSSKKEKVNKHHVI